ncbi:MAG: gamma-glutamylcyclotransferase [Hyphomicrobiales bacterium]
MERTPKENKGIYLFIYGTLLSGIPNRMEHIISNHCEIISRAYVYGYLYDINSYPGIKLSNDSNRKIWGEILKVDTYKTLKILDDYEEYGEDWPEPNEYIRKKTNVTIQANNTEQAIETWIYEYNMPTDNLMLIENNCYREYLKNIESNEIA